MMAQTLVAKAPGDPLIRYLITYTNHHAPEQEQFTISIPITTLLLITPLCPLPNNLLPQVTPVPGHSNNNVQSI
jgi:hypothetical protein